MTFVPNNATVGFTPSEIIYVFFANHSVSTQCLAQTGTTPCVVMFSPTNPQQKIVWDLASNSFIPSGPSMAVKNIPDKAEIVSVMKPIGVKVTVGDVLQQLSQTKDDQVDMMKTEM